jgi:hypothetical protein
LKSTTKTLIPKTSISEFPITTSWLPNNLHIEVTTIWESLDIEVITILRYFNVYVYFNIKVPAYTSIKVPFLNILSYIQGTILIKTTLISRYTLTEYHIVPNIRGLGYQIDNFDIELVTLLE